MQKADARLRVFAILVALMFVALSTRLWFLQVLQGPQFERIADRQAVRIDPIPALRGEIRDARGRVLVDNRVSLEIRVNRQQLGNDTEAILQHLAEVLDVEPTELAERLDTQRYLPRQPVPIAEFVPEETAAYIKEHPEFYPPHAVQVEEVGVRHYPLNRLAAHVLGYVGQIDAEEYTALQDQGYGLNDQLGKTGVESTYEPSLRGTQGKQKFIVNSDGDIIEALASIPAVDGDSLVLALDARIQGIAQQELREGLLRARGLYDENTQSNLRANGGAVVILNPNTGGVVAMASWPDYDPTWYVNGLTQDQQQYLFHSGPLSSPSSNRATQFAVPPGSAFKPLVTLSALRRGLTTLGSYSSCPATYVAPTEEGVDDPTVYTNWSTSDLGYMSIAQALYRSCDTIFYDWGFGYWDRWRQNPLGKDAEPFQKDLRQFGISRPTGIDLPSETAGVLFGAADAPKHRELFYHGQWLPGGDILISIGSSYVTATPLQLATAYGAIANGGRLCRPHLVERIVDANGNTVKDVSAKCRNLGYPKPWLEYIRNALVQTTSSSQGTAYGAFRGFPLSEIPVAGKTGTAERPPFQDTSWFVSMVPANDPQYVVVVMAEQGGFGSDTAAPIARRIIERIYGLESTGSISGGGRD